MIQGKIFEIIPPISADPIPDLPQSTLQESQRIEVYFSNRWRKLGLFSPIIPNHAISGGKGSEHPLCAPRLPDGHNRPLLSHPLQEGLDELALLLLVQSIGNLVQQHYFNLRPFCLIEVRVQRTRLDE